MEESIKIICSFIAIFILTLQNSSEERDINHLAIKHLLFAAIKTFPPKPPRIVVLDIENEDEDEVHRTAMTGLRVIERANLDKIIIKFFVKGGIQNVS